MSLAFKAGAITDVGCKRKNNEDSILSLPGNGVFCVADGMGGAREGQVASKALTDALAQAFASDDAAGLNLESKVARVRETIQQVNVWIKQRIEERGYSQMGSTVVVGVFDAKRTGRGIAVHAGDSRMYRYRERGLTQLTADHSFVTELGAKSEKSLPAEFRGVVTKAVGLRTELILDETPFDIRMGDLFFCCSDGLTRMLSDKFLLKLLRQNEGATPDALVRLLVNEAKKAGGDDNISVVATNVEFCVLPEDEGSAPATDEGITAATATVSSVPASSEIKVDITQPPSWAAGDRPSGRGTSEGYTPHTSDTGDRVPKKVPSRFAWDMSALAHRAGFEPKVLACLLLVAGLAGGLIVKLFLGGREDPSARVQVSEELMPGSGHSDAGGITNLDSTAQLANALPLDEPVDSDIGSVVPEDAPGPLVTQEVALEESMSPEEQVTGSSTEIEVLEPPPASIDNTGDPAGVSTEIAVSTMASLVEEGEANGTPAFGENEAAADPLALPELDSTETPVIADAEPVPEEPTLAQAKDLLADQLMRSRNSGQWGALRDDLGSWWDRLAQVEKDRAKRQEMQGWVKLWEATDGSADYLRRAQDDLKELDRIAQMVGGSPTVMDAIGLDGAAGADLYCRIYREKQLQLIESVGAHAKRQGAKLNRLSQMLENELPQFCQFTGSDTCSQECDKILDQLVLAARNADEVANWVKSKKNDSPPILPQTYPVSKIERIPIEADLAWDHLFVLIESMDKAIARRKDNLPESETAKLDNVASLRTNAMRNWKKSPKGRSWQKRGGVTRVYSLLGAVSKFIRADSNRRMEQNLDKLADVARRLNVKMPVLGDTEKSGEKQKKDLARQYRACQSSCLNRIENMAAVQQRLVKALGDTWKADIPRLCEFVQKDSKKGKSIIILFSGVLDQSGKLVQWVKTRREAGVLIEPDEYPISQIRSMGTDADIAWSKLLDLINPVGWEVSTKRNSSQNLDQERLDSIHQLHHSIVLTRAEVQDIRQWQKVCDPVQIRNLLQEVSSVVLNMTTPAEPSR